MYPSPFSKDALMSCFRSGDSIKFDINVAEEMEAIVDSTMAALESDTISFSHDTVQLRNGRSIFRIQDVEGALILRALSKRLVNQHKIKIPNRDQIVRGVIEGLLDATPYNILRCDISSFYENVDVRRLVDVIASSTRTHPSIKQVFRKLEGVGLLDLGSLGIPRGLGLSAVLAELELRKFDHEARQIQDVYRYFRFADDMLVFCTGPTSRLFTDLSQILPINLQFNDKTASVEIGNLPHSDKDPCDAPASEIDYLGYKFSMEKGVKQKRSRVVKVSISDNKIASRKTKIVLSLKRFVKDKDAKLLVLRLKYLTSNFEISRTGQTHAPNRKRVKTGIYYNYHFCGKYVDDKSGPRLAEHDAHDLKALDGFMNSLLWGANSEFRPQVEVNLSEAEMAALRQLSFYAGFSKRMTKRFTRAQVSDIRKAWQNA
jgi:hypothetical protein